MCSSLHRPQASLLHIFCSPLILHLRHPPNIEGEKPVARGESVMYRMSFHAPVRDGLAMLEVRIPIECSGANSYRQHLAQSALNQDKSADRAPSGSRRQSKGICGLCPWVDPRKSSARKNGIALTLTSMATWKMPFKILCKIHGAVIGAHYA